MEQNNISFIDIIKRANERLTSKNLISDCRIAPLKDALAKKGLSFINPKFESGLYLVEQMLTNYNIDKRSQLVGVISAEDRLIVRDLYFNAQKDIVESTRRIDRVGNLMPNLQKMLSSDTLLSSLDEYGMCYDFSKITQLVSKGQFAAAENIASRDWFLMRSVNYYLKAKKIANNMGSPATKENIANMDKTIKSILEQNRFYENKIVFPLGFEVTPKNQKERKIKDVNAAINRDLSKIEKTCKLENAFSAK